MRKIDGDPKCGYKTNPVLVLVNELPYYLIQKEVRVPESSFVSRYAVTENLLDQSTGFRAIEGSDDPELINTEPNPFYKVIGYGTIEFINEIEGFVIYKSSQFIEEVMFIFNRAYPNIPINIM